MRAMTTIKDMSVPGANGWILDAVMPLPHAMVVIVKKDAMKSLGFRGVNAKMFTVAAELERRSLKQEWVVNIDRPTNANGGGMMFGVYLEYKTDSEKEQNDGERVLNKLRNDLLRDIFRP